MMTEIYRLATADDAPRVQYITYEAYVTIRELKLQWPAAYADVEQIRNNILNNKCYVLEQDGQIQATVTLADAEKLQFLGNVTDLPFVMWFAVDPYIQSKGLGRKLLNWVEQHVIRAELGAPAVTLATAEKHPWLLPMYERWGYERIHAFEAGEDGVMHLLRKVVDEEKFARYVQLQKEQQQIEDGEAAEAQPVGRSGVTSVREQLQFRRF